MIVHFPEVERKLICELAQKTLWEEDTEDVAEALQYLRETRAVSDDVIKSFNFGYYPQRLRRQGHDWAGRLIMPLYEQNNNLIVLTSRDFRCTDKTKMPHLHEEFNKKLFLYGLNVAKKNIIKYQKAIVVEGQFDTACCHTHGINVAVGILGSAFSIHQLIILSRYCRDIFLVYDNDSAGRNNLQRSLLMYKNYNLSAFDIKFLPVILPKHKDPDEFLRKEGKHEFLDILAETKDKVYNSNTIDYFTRVLSTKV